MEDRETLPLGRGFRCGARTRIGNPCRSPAVRGKRRCRMHGGAAGSGAPIGNTNALRHGHYTAEAVAHRRAPGANSLGSAMTIDGVTCSAIRNRSSSHIGKHGSDRLWRRLGYRLGQRFLKLAQKPLKEPAKLAALTIALQRIQGLSLQRAPFETRQAQRQRGLQRRGGTKDPGKMMPAAVPQKPITRRGRVLPRNIGPGLDFATNRRLRQT